ncbi:MAG: 50S ribosomal protein L34e [Promethearchaeota archaeon]|nr:MAG: 50S ribosomal protein L34e [Candidatus Lokiarchaeota archaeon]
MPRPGLRSKAQKRKTVKTPGNRMTTHYWRKTPTKAQCSICKRPLQAVPHLRKAEMQKTNKIHRKANRLESGRYCAKCLHELIRDAVWQS